jgi:hypothetical protein
VGNTRMRNVLIACWVACAFATCLGACSKPQQPLHATPPDQPVQVSPTPYSTLEHVGKYAIRCSGYVVPGVPRPYESPPLSYSADDVGKPGVPHLTTAQMASLRSIERELRPGHLRFVFLGDFIVFDADAGPCADFAPGYPVLNVRPPVLPKNRRYTYNLYYEPGENPYDVHVMTW